MEDTERLCAVHRAGLQAIATLSVRTGSMMSNVALEVRLVSYGAPAPALRQMAQVFE
jgi:hypothetical protein